MSTQRSTPSPAPRRSGATLQQVADAAGVSLATASRVLNGSTRTVNAELSEHVREVATRLRYVSHGPAQALARATTSLVGLLVHDVNDPYFSAIAAGAMRVARERDLLVMVANTYREPGLELDYITRLGAQRARAILVAGSPPVDPALAGPLRERLLDYRDGGGRVVTIGDLGPDIDAVLPANAAGARAAARHLTGLGHREIGMIAGPRALVTIADRSEGFRAGLLDDRDGGGSLGGRGSGSDGGLGGGHGDHSTGGRGSGGAVIAHEIEGEFTRDGGYEATRRLLAEHPGVTAVFVMADVMAIGALAALRDAGRRVPQDVSLVGFDDLPICADLVPALTTVRVDTEGMGEQAMRIVVEEGESADGRGAEGGEGGEGGESGEGRSVVHSATELIVRESTGPAA